MATTQNHKDNLLGAHVGDREPEDGFVDVEWEDVKDTLGFKADDNATFGAEFDVDLRGLANTHNITENAVTSHGFSESYVYQPTTEIIMVEVDILPENGNVILFISWTFFSNYAATTGESLCTLRIYYNNGLVLDTPISNIPVQTGGLFLLSVAEKYYHTPNQQGDDVFLINEDDDYLGTSDGAYLVAGKDGYSLDTYKVEIEYSNPGDGVRGKIGHLAVYGLVLKR